MEYPYGWEHNMAQQAEEQRNGQWIKMILWTKIMTKTTVISVDYQIFCIFSSDAQNFFSLISSRKIARLKIFGGQ